MPGSRGPGDTSWTCELRGDHLIGGAADRTFPRRWGRLKTSQGALQQQVSQGSLDSRPAHVHRVSLPPVTDLPITADCPPALVRCTRPTASNETRASDTRASETRSSETRASGRREPADFHAIQGEYRGHASWGFRFSRAVAIGFFRWPRMLRWRLFLDCRPFTTIRVRFPNRVAGGDEQLHHRNLEMSVALVRYGRIPEVAPIRHRG